MKFKKVHALRQRGFVLVITVMMMALLTILGLGMLSLATLTLRATTAGLEMQRARANARMALIQAIGQMQLTLGPDQRVSATAEILGDGVAQPQWTGAWRSREKDGSDWLTRDDLNGGLRDARYGDPAGEQEAVMEWLVSGGAKGDPRTADAGDMALLVSSARGGGQAVSAPRVEIHKSGEVSGHEAWWTGDLGVRANVQTSDAHVNDTISASAPTQNAYARVLASQRVEEGMMTGKVEIDPKKRPLLASELSVSLGAGAPDWAISHFFDYTTYSSGVLADVNHGGLKKDLTAFMTSDGTIADRDGMTGLKDEDVLVGQEPATANQTRHDSTAPRFGLLRNWAKAAIPFAGTNIAAVPPETASTDKNLSENLALSNEQSVKLEGNHAPALQPVLVEAANYTQMSTYRNSPGFYQLRTLLYPRVVLWNPYNVELQTQRSIIVMQGNGRQEMWTLNRSGNATFTSEWLSFEGGRNTSINTQDLANDAGYNDPYMGSYYFTIPATKFPPGECLVFSPAQAAEYNGRSEYRPGVYDLSANELSCTVSPDPSRSYYVSASDAADQGEQFIEIAFWYAPTPGIFGFGSNGVVDQGDDCRAILKALPAGSGPITFEAFDALPQLCVLSGSLQYGAGKEPRVAWNPQEHMNMELLTKASPHPTTTPNVRTREGIRMRWFDETQSNRLNSGPLSNTPHFQEAILANWNPRAAYNVRSPWENIAGTLPTSGSSSGPWFFGSYTRDLYDKDVSWDNEAPFPSGGTFHGNPFGPPQEGKKKIVLFDVPRAETGIVSLGQFQHVQLSNFVWHPSYAAGNSLADPRLGLKTDHTAATADSSDGSSKDGFQKDSIGWSNDHNQSPNPDAWAANGRAILQNTPATDNLVYDLSYEVNRTLWDRYYFSTGGAAEKAAFLSDPFNKPLPNGRLKPAPGQVATASQLSDFHASAAHLILDGAFNVNSTRVEAWKALLGSTRTAGYGSSNGKNTPFPRVLNPPGGAWTAGTSTDSDNAWSGYRELTDGEIDSLATEMVKEVKLRGPFLSLADFVNRRLANDDTGKMGALQAAIEHAGLNGAFESAYPLDNTKSLPDYSHPDNIKDATRMEQTLKPASKAWGMPGYLTQADVLQALGPALSARSDSFVVRAYGDAVDRQGAVTARAWCEAVVQRLPEPLKPDASGLNPKDPEKAGDFGRRFALVSFRWLNEDEL